MSGTVLTGATTGYYTVAPRSWEATTLTETSTNHLLGALPDDVRLATLPFLERVRLPLRAPVQEPGASVRYLYLPIDCVISVVMVLHDGTQIEVQTIGREGLTGTQALLGGGPSVALSVCQIPGEAYRIPFEAFRHLFERFSPLRELVERYLSAQLDVMAQSIACNRRHHVSQRTARWLLMTFDRVGHTGVPITHEVLATMLGVRRAGVSIAAAMLQNAGFINYSRGRFGIVDRDGLIRASCECYGAINDAFVRRGLPQP